MGIYICTVCGYDYDPAVGDPAAGVAPGTAFEDLPEDWVCPVCGADKSMFRAQGNEGAKPAAPAGEPAARQAGAAADALVLAARCSNLARGCAKQYREEEAGLLTRLAAYFTAQAQPEGDADSLMALLKQDLDAGYPRAFEAARAAGDRGALRALTWGEKVTRMRQSLLSRYQGQGAAAFEGAKLFVCEACGFIFAGDLPPDICPVCKVPRFKFNEVTRGASA